MIVVTVATEKKGYYDLLVKSCEIHGLTLITLGLGMKWTGFSMKYRLMREYLHSIPENEIIVFVDAYDVIINDNEESIITKFTSFGTDIVFGTQDGLLSKMTFTHCFGHVLCGGCYIGYASRIKQLLHILNDPVLIEETDGDDQEMLNRACSNNFEFFDEFVSADADNILFFTTDASLYLDPKYIVHDNIGLYCNNETITTKKGIRPSILHFAAGVNGKKYLTCLDMNSSDSKHIMNEDLSWKFKHAQGMLKLIHAKHYNLLTSFTIVTFIILIFMKVFCKKPNK